MIDGNSTEDRLIDELLTRWEQARDRGQAESSEQLCKDRPHLTNRVRDAIASLQKIDALLNASIIDAPRIVGPYRILELLGAGGMGAVYKAEQQEPIRRLVAIKLIKAGVDTAEVISRFNMERQALARMDHPGIARILDAGAMPNGRPYFVMEFVPGAPVTTFADEHHLPIRERLLLFIQICQAIAHAHTKAIIHRDIKPGNVLAYMNEGRAVVKVIDFGIAKALTGDGADASFATTQGRVIGTFDSMSPEQADGSLDIDTRTDVYALGVLLYQLLAGVKPFSTRTSARTPENEMRRLIREVEPPRPVRS